MRRLVYIDVLRGIAILTVVFHHLPVEFGSVFGRLQEFGGRGVDLFFVLSGFLIGSTCLTRAETQAPRIAQAKAYWLLRTLRIWPLYFGLLALYAARVPIFDAEVGRIVREQLWYYLLFFSNDLGQPTLELGVLWSLAIEEQFYLAVGALVLFASHKRETLAAAFLALGLAAIAVSLRTRFDLVRLNHDRVLDDGLYTYKLYFSTLSRIDQLGLGLLSAVAAPWVNARAFANDGRLARVTTWGAILGLLAVLLWMPQIRRFEFLVVGALFAAAVLWTQRPAARSMTMGAFEKLVVAVLGSAGKLSFGFYLFHPFVRGWTTRAMQGLGMLPSASTAPLFMGCWVAACWSLSWVSYRLVEEPLLGWARRWAAKVLGSRPAPALAGQAAATPEAVSTGAAGTAPGSSR